MRRIAFFSKSKSRTLYTTYIMRALRRLGCEVHHVRQGRIRRWLGGRVAHAWTCRSLERWPPDAIVVFSRDIRMETLDHFTRPGHAAPVAFLLDDYFPVEDPGTEKIRKGDVFFLTMTGQLEAYARAGVKRPIYLHSGVDPEIHRPGSFTPRFASDVAFIGGASYPERNAFVADLHSRVDLKLYGPGWGKLGLRSVTGSLGVPGYRRVCSSARIVLGIDKSADMELYFSNRTWFVLGCGGFLLTRYVPGLERMFANHRHLVWYRDLDEALDQVRWYLAHDAERRAIARAGHAFAHTTYPFDRTARNILRVLFEDLLPEPLSDPGASLARGAISTQARSESRG